MRHFELVALAPLMDRSVGSPEVVIGLIDGPVATDHPGFEGATLRTLRDAAPGRCAIGGAGSGAACAHGTAVAGVLAAARGADAHGICPGCPVVVRPIFSEPAPSMAGDGAATPAATPEELAAAVVDCVDAGARLLNVS